MIYERFTEKSFSIFFSNTFDFFDFDFYLPPKKTKLYLKRL